MTDIFGRHFETVLIFIIKKHFTTPCLIPPTSELTRLVVQRVHKRCSGLSCLALQIGVING